MDSLIHRLFEAQAARVPDHIALSYEGQRLTYRELNQRSNQVAHRLRSLGVGPDILVGLYCERTPDLVVGLLGILKAGGAYVPIDPQYPRERLTFMLQDSHADVIVTQQSLGAVLEFAGAKILLLDGHRSAIEEESTENPDVPMTAENLAYVIYTSGSTGVPKGMLISHRNVARLFSATAPWFEFSDRDVWTLFHSAAFDFSVWELWGALSYGGRLVIVPFGVSRTPSSFYELLKIERVTMLNQTPSAFRQLIRAEEEAAVQRPEADAALVLRFVIFGGEALDFNTLKPWFERHGDVRPQLVNMYGITETTVHVTYRPIRAADTAGSSVIGIPIPDLDIQLLDEALHPVPQGTPGEIFVGGAGVGRGYLNRPELTAARFIADPLDADGSRRLYRSGDLARFLPNGELEYLGRIDGQVKIRGFRIELGEISAMLNLNPKIRESVVIVREPTPGDKVLVAYVVARDGVPPSTVEIRQRLRERLPEYMIPAQYVFLDRLPITVNGKVDTKALPPPPEAAPVTPLPKPVGPAASLEEGIAAIWCEVLKVPSVEFDQNFFDVGGTSIHLADIHARLQTLLMRRFSITELFSHSTVRGLAGHFRGDDAGGSGAANRQRAQRQRAQRQREMLAAQRNLRRDRP